MTDHRSGVLMLEDRQLSQMFLRKGLVDEEKLDKAAKMSADTGASLYDVLLTEGMVDEEKAIVAVSKQLNLPCVSLKEFDADPKILDLVARDLAIQFKLMPLGLTEEDGERKLYVAMANPLDIEAIEKVSKTSGFPVVQLLAGPGDIATAIERSYGDKGKPMGASGDLDMGDMLDGLFEDGKDAPASTPGSEQTPARAEPVSGSEAGMGGFTLDFGDLELNVGDKPTVAASAGGGARKAGDVHDRMTLPAGTVLPGAARFKREATIARAPEELESLAAESSDLGDKNSSVSGLGGGASSGLGDGDAGGGGMMDDWSDLATFGIEEDEDEGPSRGSSQAPLMRTDTSTVRYVADPSLQRGDKDGFPHNIPSSDLIRAAVNLLVQKGILTEEQIKEEIKKIRHGSRRRR